MTEKLEKQTKKLNNGLQITVVPMSGFNQVYGLAMTNFGSVDTKTNEGTLPAGIAHFIEHYLPNLITMYQKNLPNMVLIPTLTLVIRRRHIYFKL